MPLTNIRSGWSSGDLIFHESGSRIPASGYNVLTIGDDAVTVGDGSNDIDFKAYFGSTSNYLLVDEGSEKVTIAKTWSTGAQTGRPFEVDSTVNAALGSYSNAIKGYVVYGTSGKTTGLGSAVNAEILLSTGTTEGNYAPLESELVADSAVSTGTATGFFYCNVAGSNSTGKTSINTNGYLFILGTGVVDTANGLFDVVDADDIDATAALRIKVGATDYFIPISTTSAFNA